MDFHSLFSSLSNEFSALSPGVTSVVCFAKGFGAGFGKAFLPALATGFVAGAALAGIALLSAPVAIGIGVAAAVVGLGMLGYEVYKIAPQWKSMSPHEKGEFLGGIAGGVTGGAIGGAAGAAAVSGLAAMAGVEGGEVAVVNKTEPKSAEPADIETRPERLLPAPAEPQQPTVSEQVESLPGHGHARHGAQTTIEEQVTRVQTGEAPDGTLSPTKRATKFDNDEAELDAVMRGKVKAQERVNNGQASETIVVSPDGVAKLPRQDVVVGGRSEGYGSGVEVVRDPITNKRLPGSPVRSTGQDPNARVVLEYNPATGEWEPITQYPTNAPETP